MDALIQKARAEAKTSEKSQLISRHHSCMRTWTQDIHCMTYPWKYLLSKYYVADTVELPNSF